MTYTISIDPLYIIASLVAVIGIVLCIIGYNLTKLLQQIQLTNYGIYILSAYFNQLLKWYVEDSDESAQTEEISKPANQDS